MKPTALPSFALLAAFVIYPSLIHADMGIIPIPYGGKVSADGSTLTAGVLTPGSGFLAGYWNRVDGAVTIGSLAGTPSFVTSSLNLSANGSVVVGGSNSAESGSTIPQAFRWTATTGMLGLGDLAGGNFHSKANSVSADGSVVVGFAHDASGQVAFRWTEVGGMTRLGVLTGFTGSLATDISADGLKVVGYSHSGTVKGGFLWSDATGLLALGGLPTQITQWSSAEAISGDGTTVVGVAGRDAAGSWEAFRWTQSGGMVGLGDLPGGSFWGVAEDVSGDGSVIVGWSYVASNTTNAFIWDQTNGMRNLRTVLLNGGADLTGWSELQRASGISADGVHVVGFGVYNGVNTAFLATLADDDLPPVITLVGGSSLTVQPGQSWSDPGATAFDASDGNLPVIVGGDVVNVSTAGNYAISYTAQDTAGNTAHATRTVTVTPYGAWAATHGLVGPDAQIGSDPDHDGINLYEFALDGDPNSGAQDGKVVGAVNPLTIEGATVDYLTLTLPVRSGATFTGALALGATVDGVSYLVRASLDLAAWEVPVVEVTPPLDDGLPTLDPNYEYRTFRLNDPVSTANRGFLGLVVNEAAP